MRWKATRAAILERDGFRCQFCGEADRSSLRVDHRIPQALGGDDSPENLWTLCLWCNSIKRTRLVPFQIGLPRNQCGTCGKYNCSIEHERSLTRLRNERRHVH